MAGCAAAKQVIRVVEEQDKSGASCPPGSELASATELVRRVIRHQSVCGARGEACLVCALVNRARPRCRGSTITLDFSRANASPSFEVPERSTTEELAMLLSDLSRRPKPVRRRDDDYDPTPPRKRVHDDYYHQYPKPPLRVVTHGVAAPFMPRSPSFSAAANSLLALTASKPLPHPSAPTLIMPQC